MAWSAIHWSVICCASLTNRHDSIIPHRCVQFEVACDSHFGHVTIEMASGGGDRLKSYKPLFKDIEVTRREREEAGVVLRRRKRNEEVGACSFRGHVSSSHALRCCAQ